MIFVSTEASAEGTAVLDSWLWTAMDAVARELLGFAAFGVLLLGFDDILMDGAWLLTARPRRRIVRAIRAAPDASARLAVLIPAWDEAEVIGAMLRHTLSEWRDEDVRVLVGVYPNDPATRRAVEAVAASDARLRTVVIPPAGPTTKGDCLNHLWRRAEAQGDTDAVVLHDAEDVVAPGELALFRRLLADHDMVQLPVVPSLTRRAVGDSYFDEFAEAHGKDLPTRQALGASIPGAGVGCALTGAALRRLDGGAGPFPVGSLVEDYELGLRIHESGGRTLFVPASATGGAVVVRARFPATIETAVRQKSRWVAGIALNGWDRIGWRRPAIELWMRLRDRRAPLAAAVLTAGYAGLALSVALVLLNRLGWGAWPSLFADRWLVLASAATGAMLLWRLAVRAIASAAAGGWREGLRSMPRAVASNIVAILAARRAIGHYAHWRRTGEVRWDKTPHEFPELVG